MHIIGLEFSYMSGKRKVYHNGVMIHFIQQYFFIFNFSVRIKFFNLKKNMNFN